jgi:lipopolysaccharide transport system ATP-binding protein
MSGGTVIKVENLGKSYVIGHQVEGDLRGSFSRRLSRLMSSSRAGTREEFWALKDVSFEVKKGEAVGIIGRNGAGKSTLLKILSRITDPSTGRFEISGRVSSLLEVGTGFHPELTGRENVYLNGTILGMRRAEIRKKFDAIVDFSGVEKFLDTPVKHYSSGMKVRLAFSVAAHLEPEILIIDEVLAVGDAEFQKKCLGKMDEVSQGEGRTVLFVSHNMGAVQGLCSKGILLNRGVVDIIDSVGNVIQRYLESGRHQIFDVSKLPRTGTEQVYFDTIDFFATGGELLPVANGQVRLPFLSGVEIRMRLKAKNDAPRTKVYVAITIKDLQGTKLMTLDNLYIDQPFDFRDPSCIEASCIVETVRINPGLYRIDLWCSDGFETYQKINDALELEIVEADRFGTGKVHHSTRHGFFYQKHQWKQVL